MLASIQRFLIRAFIPLLSAFLGCSTYHNVTAYFNTYYNAQKLFSEAETDIEKLPRKDADTNYFAVYHLPRAIDDKLDKVIEKGSKLIQSYPQTSWIDDAIIMIGKSYVYEGDDEPALRKFGELLANFPTSGLRFEAKLWSAKALYHMKKEAEAIKVITELFPEARQEGKNDILLEALLLQGEIYFGRGEYAQAEAIYQPAIEVSGNDALRTIGQSRLALCYERSGDQKKAAQAYGRVRKFSPDFPVEFRARLKEGEMYSRAGEFQKSLDVFEDLRSEALKNDDRALVELETANTLRRMGDTTRAFQWYDVVDTVYARTDAAAKSYFERGLMYEKEYGDFKKALKFYDRARTENSASEITPVAQAKSQTLTQYFSLYTRLHSLDTMYVSALHRDSAKAASPPGTSKRLSEASLDLPKSKAPADSSVKKFAAPDSTPGQIARPDDEADEQPHRRGGLDDPAAKGRQMARVDIDELKALTRRDSLATDSLKTRKSKTTETKIATPALSPDSIHALAALGELELAGLFYLRLDLPDSALDWYGRMIRDYPLSAAVPKALYAMSEIHRSRQDSVAVDSLYRIILGEYGQSEYAQQVKRLRGMDIEDAEATAADKKYARAEKLLEEGKIGQAIAAMRQIVRNSPRAAVAPKALYAIGWIYESVLVQNDSAAACYKRLMKAYPSTIYAKEVQPKVAVKDDPKSLSQYVKVKEIQLLKPQFAADKRAVKGGGKDAEAETDDEEVQQGRHGARDDSDDNSDDQDDTTDPDDDNN